MFSETMALTDRSMKKWIRNPAAVMPALFQAIFWLVLFGNSFNPTGLGSSNVLQHLFGGAANYISYLTPGIIASIVIFNMAFGGLDIVLDRQQGFLNVLLTDPIRRSSIYLAGVIQNFAKAMIQVVLSFIIALLIPNGLRFAQGFGILDLLGLIAVISFMALGFSFMFTALAICVNTPDSLIAIVNVLAFPITFMSNSLFPQDSFPEWLKTISQYNPVSKANEAARLLISRNLSSAQFSTFTFDLAYLVGFIAVFAILGLVATRHALRAK